MGRGKATIAIRPERIRLTDAGVSPIAGRIHTRSFVSGQTIYRIVLEDGREMIVKVPANLPEYSIGEQVGVQWSADDAVVLDAD